MNERIKLIRKEAKLSQEEFGNRIRITKSSVSLLESGRNKPSEQTIRLICREFSINEEWLRSGIGEMFRALPEEDELSVYIEELLDGTDDKVHKAIRAFLLAYGKMNSVSKKVMNELIDNWLEEMKKEQD